VRHRVPPHSESSILHFAPRILGIIRLHYYFLCWLLAAYWKLNDFWSYDLSPLSEDFLNGPLLLVL